MEPKNLPPKILVVDDKPENLIAMKRLLAKVDGEVLTAEGGKQALSLLVNNDIAVALLDVQMPEMDGYELAKLIRGHQATAKMPIIFLTANYKAGKFISKGYEVGAVDYLCKPFETEILLSKINFFLDLHREKSQNKDLITMLERTLARLEESNQELSEYAYLAGHDLKAPLRNINNLVEIALVEHGEELPDATVDRLRVISRLCQRMASLIESMLTMARADRLALQLQEVPVKKVVEEVQEMVNSQETTNQKILIKGELPTIKCDRHRLQQVFLNLIANGLKYNRSQEKVVNITFDEAEQAFCVEDNGIGIDPEFQEDVFKMCKRLESDDAFGPGTGIGLALVKKIIRQHGGEIRVESQPEKGTRMVFTLAAKEETALV